MTIFLKNIWKFPDFSGIFRKIYVFLYFVNFCEKFLKISIFVKKIENKSSFSPNFAKNNYILDGWNIFIRTC